jgi:hypothetical protein
MTASQLCFATHSKVYSLMIRTYQLKITSEKYLGQYANESNTYHRSAESWLT